MKTNNRAKTAYLTELSVLVALIAILTFTPLGFLKIGIIEMTLITIPVAIGGILLGPKAGAILGGVFGIFSFLQCIWGLSAFGVALLEINPVLTFIICVIPRILCGWLPALIFKAIYPKDKTKIVSVAVSSALTSLFNTLFFIVFVAVFFGKTDYIKNMVNEASFIKICIAFVVMLGINALGEVAATTVVGTAVSKAVLSYKKH